MKETGSRICWTTDQAALSYYEKSNVTDEDLLINDFLNLKMLKQLREDIWGTRKIAISDTNVECLF